MNSNEVYDIIKRISVTACEKMNDFSASVLRTRGGRIGSGMGALLEALWGYMMNQIIIEHPELDCEIAWFPDNQYNDFSCIKKDVVWDETTREGEYFRIEVKSMNTGADESKAHFAALQKEIEPNDALLILVWEWRQVDETHFTKERRTMFQIVIDLSEDVYTRLYDNGTETSAKDIAHIETAIRKGTIISENATNGEVIKALFPEWECLEYCSRFGDETWNMPYGKGTLWKGVTTS